ncbi:MAG: VCBS repeat-containing protein, partial [Pirellulales bacterium]
MVSRFNTSQHRKPRSALGSGRRFGAVVGWWIIGLAIVGAAMALCLVMWSPRSTEKDRSHPAQGPLTPSDAAVVGQRQSEQNTPSPTIPASTGQSWQKLDDPTSDGWSTEAYSERINQTLKQLGKLLQHGKRIDTRDLEKFVSPQFSCRALLPASTRSVMEDKVVTVLRGEIDAASIEPSADEPYQGSIGLASALNELVKPYFAAKGVRFKFKVFNVHSSGDKFVSRQYFAISGQTPDGMLEQNSTWVIHWSPQSDTDDGADGAEKQPRILWIGVEQFEQVISKSNTAPWFTDCTESVLGNNESFHDQFLHGMNHWLERVQDTRYFSSLGNPGLAVGDVNGDGLDDLFVCQESHLPNRLFLQQPDGSAKEVSATWGVDWLENSRSALLLDLDNDGDQDLVVALLGALVIADNQQNQGFEIRQVLSTDDDTMSLSAADYDNDGDLDIYVCVDYGKDFFSEDQELSVLGGASNRVYHDANNAGENSLFRNDISMDGEWQFTDVTTEVGLEVNNRRFSLAAAWEDFDNDGDQDLYVSNDFGRNNLYRNDATVDGKRKFTDIAKQANAEDSASGMSAAWGDFDRDGRMDLYVANMFSAAGGRIMSQPEFKSDATDEVKARLRRFSRGSTLMQ